MINKIFNYLKKNVKKSHLILVSISLILILSGIISWNVYFSKYYIFGQTEKYFLERAENYYKYHSVYLPKEGKVKVMTLEEMYEKKQIDTLKVPKSNDLCDATNSWVKVYNDKGEYRYYTYLKCGKYESSVDHTGPSITLKGDNPQYVSLNKEYQEAGIEKVIDDKDGSIDISKVVIDSSKVNTKKVGKYDITYTVRDKLNNETKVTRRVIVARNLTDIVRESTGESNYYQGNVSNNYVLFSGMMYRIINVNSDGTVKLISNENLNNLRIYEDNYENSNVDLYLTNEYLKIIHDQSYLVESEYCVGKVTDYNSSDSGCDIKVKRKVGLLSYTDLKNSFINNDSYLCNTFYYALGNRTDSSFMQINYTNSNCVQNGDKETLPVIRPVITLKANLIILSGSGTRDNPYKLNDYSYGKQQDKVNTRLVGEYVNYSGNVFRIIRQDGDNTRLIMIDGLKRNVSGETNSLNLTLSVPNSENYVFNTTDDNNPGYIINNDFIDYINDSYIVSSEYEIPTNVINKNYKDYKTKKIKTKIVLPKTYDLFSSVQTVNQGFLYLYLDDSENANNIFSVNINNGKVYDSIADLYNEYCIKPVITINGDLKIKSGKGTISSPYYINK